MEIRRIVVGVDGSAGSASAVRWCAALASATDAEVYAVHGLGVVGGFMLAVPPSRLGDWKEELRRGLHLWCEPLREAGVTYREELIDAEAVPAIVETADNHDADLVVVGAQGDGGFVDRMLGGVTYKLAHHGRRPVVIVPVDSGTASG